MAIVKFSFLVNGVLETVRMLKMNSSKVPFFLIPFSLFFLVPTTSNSNNEKTIRLFPFLQGGVGFVDTTGKLAIQPQFEDAGDFLSDVTWFKKGGKIGLVSKNGEIVLPPKYDTCAGYSDGFYKVKLNSKLGYVDSIGKEVIDIKYDDLGDFAEGLAWVKLDGKFGYINTHNELVTPVVYEAVNPFSEGLASVNKDGVWSYIDASGKEIIKTDYALAASFSEGLACVQEKGEDFSGYEFIDKTGKVVIDSSDILSDYPPSFMNGYAEFRRRSGAPPAFQTTVIDKKGETVFAEIDQTPPDDCQNCQDDITTLTPDKRTSSSVIKRKPLLETQHVDRNALNRTIKKITQLNGISTTDFYGLFLEGHAYVCDRGNWKSLPPSNDNSLKLAKVVVGVILQSKKVGFFDTEGKMISGWFSDIRPFHNGLARVSTGLKCGFVDQTGKILISPGKYDFGIHVPTDGIGLAFIGKDIYSIDANGNTLSQYEDTYKAKCALKGQTLVKYYQGNKMGFTDQTGKVVVEPQYEVDGGSQFSEELIQVRVEDEKTGYMNSSGKLVTPLKFCCADSFSEGLAAAAQDRQEKHKVGYCKYGYIDKTGNFAIQPAFEAALPFSEGLAAVKYFDNDVSGFIDTKGNLKIKIAFITSKPFSEGYAAVKIGKTVTNSKWGFIDKNGNIVIKPEFLDVGGFHDGLAVVRVPGKGDQQGNLGYIDKKGNFIVQPIYEGGTDFEEGIASVNIGTSVYYLNKQGETIFEYFMPFDYYYYNR